MTKKTKDKIIFTAESLLESNEYKDISIREVAFLSGISIGTFYRYMNSKEELLEQLKIKFDQKVYNTLLKQTACNDFITTSLVTILSSFLIEIDPSDNKQSAYK